jgi:hypothetical protein
MRQVERPLPPSAQQEIEGEWTFRLGDLELSPGMVGHLEAARRVLLREPERSRRVLRLLCASYLAREEARELPPQKTGRLGQVRLCDIDEPVRDGQIQRSALPRQSGGTGRSPRSTAGGAGPLAGLNPRRQAATLEV